MVGLGKPQQRANLKLLASTVAETLKGKPQNSGSSPRPGQGYTLFLLMGFNDGLWANPCGMPNLKSLAH